MYNYLHAGHPNIEVFLRQIKQETEKLKLKNLGNWKISTGNGKSWAL